MNIKKIQYSFPLRILLYTLALIYVYPLIFALLTSMKTTNEFISNFWALPTGFHIENYSKALIHGRMAERFLNSVIIVAATLSITTVFSILAAYALARLHVPYGSSIIAILFIMQILPTESMVIPLYMMMSKLSFFRVLYLPMVLAYAGWLLPGTIVILQNFFASVPGELIETSRIDGSSEMRTMFQIIVPLSGGAIATVSVFNFGFVWGELMWAQIATLTTERGIPLSVGLMNFQGQFTTDWGPMTAAICIILIPSIVLFLFLQKYFIQGLTSGAVKG